MIRFNDLLRGQGIDPRDVTVLLHTPPERALALALPMLAETDPALYDAFQSYHAGPATRTLQGRPLVASFVRVESGALTFVGLSRIAATHRRRMQDMAGDPNIRHLMEEFGTFQEFRAPAPDATCTTFDLDPLPALAALKGRLQIRPVLTRAYARLAETLDAEVVALSEHSVLTPTMPAWRDLVLAAGAIRTLPPLWSAALRQWRGVYLILDTRDGARYVGAAYGADNLLGRWQGHVAGAAGITAELKHRNPATFLFSILELVSPSAPPEEVIAAEQGWKRRLHTREFGLNAN